MKIFQKIATILLIILIINITIFQFSYAFKSSTNTNITQQARKILKNMSLEEKIGQKLMLDIRYWCVNGKPDKTCMNNFIEMNDDVATILSQNAIGGVILFAENLHDITQITRLTYNLQRAMKNQHQLPLLIGTDQEGGIVVRLPRFQAASYSGNMSLGASYLGQPNKQYTSRIGEALAHSLKTVGINIDFAPDTDVNVNPKNPVINIRSFSDDPDLVAKLGGKITKAMQQEGVSATIKHFPGHGDTSADSHIGLPIVNHTLEKAWKIDLYPFQQIIKQNPPDLIMTAHIQYPALDNSKIKASKSENEIIVPATLSRKIQHDLLRKQMGYQGITITDALDMGAIANHFEQHDVVIKVFQAGVDIALMPLTIRQASDIYNVQQLIQTIKKNVEEGILSKDELNESVLRILKLKIKRGLLKPDEISLTEKINQAKKIIGNPKHRELEKDIADASITLIQNKERKLPLSIKNGMYIHILTPWGEQGAAINEEIKYLQMKGQLPPNITVSYTKMSETNFSKEKKAINNADIVIVGNSTTDSSPAEAKTFQITGSFKNQNQYQGSLVFPDTPLGDSELMKIKLSSFIHSSRNEMKESAFAYKTLAYATSQGKTTIFLSLRAPYDLPNYRDVSDVMLAVYNPYGYLKTEHYGYFRSPNLPAVVRILFGINQSKGKLPLDIPNPNNIIEIVYKRGFSY